VVDLSNVGTISRIAGPFILAKGMTSSRMYELVHVGNIGVIGEIIRLEGEMASIQAYENTTGIKPGEKVLGTGRSLFAELGPGIIGQIFDGIQRPLPVIQSLSGINIKRGITPPPLNRKTQWHFQPTVKKGMKIVSGDIIGVIQETPLIEHRVIVPPWVKNGSVEFIVSEGKYTVTDRVAEVSTESGFEKLFLMHSWPVRQPRPYASTLTTDVPLITGQRVIDTFFPLTKGGTAMISGGFGTGKTVLLQVLAQLIDVDVVILVGCGERGNEMADVLEKFPQLKDFRSGKSLMDRTIIIANTSDMPIAAREASVYMAATLAEYYRDMGYDIALMVDSTSRWAEALREISGRLEEMPGEEGYPAYLASKLAGFYSRACYVKTIGSEERQGSVTIMGSVSPPGGDFSEPVTRSTLRLTRVFWALDFTLAHRRHFPAINWVLSHSEYAQILEQWYEQIGSGWLRLREEAMSLLREEEELREIVSLIGAEILDDKQRIVFEAAKMIKEFFLLQNSFHPIDVYCPMEKTYQMLRLLLKFSAEAKKAVDLGVSLEKILALGVREDLGRMKIIRYSEFSEMSSVMDKKMDVQFDNLIKETEERGLK
jgi:V/A-type H+-transporting ATPase subunit A